MKKKIKKEYIKTNLIGFIIAGIIVSGVVVYAAITFPSNEVSYSNTESGLNSNNVQGAIDELYETCTRVPAGDQIIENAGLEKDPYECRYFFTGANPNNYITFNGENAGWRIISVECDGTIKIMRNASIGDIAWNSERSSNWAHPASLNTYLNVTYYSSFTSTAQSQVVAKDWSIGSISSSYNDESLAEQINKENATAWNGEVALITVSEYIRSHSNKAACGTLYQLSLNFDNICKNKTWMYDSAIDWWTLSPHSGGSAVVFHANRYGYASYDDVDDTTYAVRPSVYLSSKIKITDGIGTSTDPYQISL